MPAKRSTPHYQRPERQSGEIATPRHLKGREKWAAIGRPMTLDEYRAANGQVPTDTTAE